MAAEPPLGAQQAKLMNLLELCCSWARRRARRRAADAAPLDAAARCWAGLSRLRQACPAVPALQVPVAAESSLVLRSAHLLDHRAGLLVQLQQAPRMAPRMAPRLYSTTRQAAAESARPRPVLASAGALTAQQPHPEREVRPVKASAACQSNASCFQPDAMSQLFPAGRNDMACEHGSCRSSR